MAKQEVEKHIQSLISKHGSFNYATLKTQLNIVALESHFQDMFPDARKQLVGVNTSAKLSKSMHGKNHTYVYTMLRAAI